MKISWPAAERNREPILAVLRESLPSEGLVLEIASGPGQHAAWFAPRLPDLRWQPTDPKPEHLDSIAAWRDEVATANLLAPLPLDVLGAWPIDRADAVVNINMIHVAPWEATHALFAGAARLLAAGAPMVMYGPYLRGPATAESNLRFSESLRERDPSWGVRELEEVLAAAAAAGLELERIVEMPANNLSVVYRRT